MPFFYDIANTVTTNATINTETDHLRLLTVANQNTLRIVGLLLAAHQGTAVGAMRLRLKTFATASTAGTSFTPNKRHPDSPAAATTAFTAPTVGATPSIRVSVGGSVLGGTGGWAALDVDHAVARDPNGGANGNADLISISQIASTSLDYTLEMSEG